MRVKLLKKMYRQANEALKRGDVFQQRPCPFYNEMHRIFSGTEASSLTSNAQSLLTDEDDDELDETADEERQIHSDNEENLPVDAPTSRKTDDKLAQAIDRLIQYQEQNEVGLGRVRVSQKVHTSLSFEARWYTYLEQQATLESQRRQEDRAYQLQLIQLLAKAVSSKAPSSSLLQQLLGHSHSSTEKSLLQQQDDSLSRAQKRKSSATSSNEENHRKARPPLPPNFYSLLAQIHNIDNTSNPS